MKIKVRYIDNYWERECDFVAVPRAGETLDFYDMGIDALFEIVYIAHSYNGNMYVVIKYWTDDYFNLSNKEMNELLTKLGFKPDKLEVV